MFKKLALLHAFLSIIVDNLQPLHEFLIMLALLLLTILGKIQIAINKFYTNLPKMKHTKPFNVKQEIVRAKSNSKQNKMCRKEKLDGVSPLLEADPP